jgi:hypothetical protein
MVAGIATGLVYALPTNPAYTFTSPAQPILYAGSKATITLSFDSLAPGSNPLTLVADPAQNTDDMKRTNNTATVVVNVK